MKLRGKAILQEKLDDMKPRDLRAGILAWMEGSDLTYEERDARAARQATEAVASYAAKLAKAQGNAS